MDLKSEKLSVLQEIINTEDESLIRDIKTLISTRDSDWFDELNQDQKKDVLEGISQLDSGEIFSHEEAKKRFNAQ